MPPPYQTRSHAKRLAGQLEEYFAKTTPRDEEFQELIVSYMNPALAMLVCRKWCFWAEEKPEKMMQLEVKKIEIKRDDDNQPWSRWVIEIHFNSDFSRRFENVNPANVFNLIRFFHTMAFKLKNYEIGSFDDLNESIPSSWRKDIKKLTYYFTPGYDDSPCLKFAQGFSNLTDLKVVRSRRFYGTALVMPYVRAMSSVQRIRFDSGRRKLEDTDSTLQLICEKSNKISEVDISCKFSLKTIIDFIKNGSFSEKVILSFCHRDGENQDELMDFLKKSCDGVCIRTERPYIEFVYGGTSFQLNI